MRPGLPGEETVQSAIALATRAPSAHNAQPWRWRIAPSAVYLDADRTRQLPAVDPHGRDLLLSCGAALHHLRVAFAAMGWTCLVHRLPDPSDAECLARVELTPHRTTMQDIGLAAAISARRADRRRYTIWQVPNRLLSLLAQRATEEGMMLRAVTNPETRYRLVSAITEAKAAQAGMADLTAAGNGRRQGSLDGPPVARTPGRPGDDVLLWATEDSSSGDDSLGDEAADVDAEDDAAVLLVLGAAADDRLSQLRAGEALSAVLLAATDLGLASCPLSQPLLEVDWTRELVRTRVLSASTYPQAVLRVGWAPLDAEPLPATPRRPLAEIVEHVTG